MFQLIYQIILSMGRNSPSAKNWRTPEGVPPGIMHADTVEESWDNRPGNQRSQH